jgi:hypothetical protein
MYIGIFTGKLSVPEDEDEDIIIKNEKQWKFVCIS